MSTLFSLSIKAKLVCLTLFFLFVPLLVFGYLWYEKSTTIIESNAIDYNGQLMQQISGRIDSYFKEIERSSYPLITHPLIQKLMKLTPEEQYERFEVTKEIQDYLIPNIMFGRAEFYNFSIVSNSGVIATSSGRSGIEERYRTYLKQTSLQSNYNIMGISKIDNLPILTITRKYLDLATYQTIGMLVIDLRLTEIAKMGENVRMGKSGFIWIVDSNGSIVYHPETDRWGQHAKLPSFKENHKLHSEITEAGGIKKLNIYQRSPVTDWTIITEVPLQELNGNLIELRRITIFVGGLLVLTALFLFGGFSFYITHSLSLLQRLMRKAEEGDLHVRAIVRHGDEIGDLYRSFNRMVIEIRRLIEVVHASALRERETEIKQRESELRAMQSQINPHFLYNTLEVINSHAIVQGYMNISYMVTSLADMFRYSIGNPEQAVTLKQELESIGLYLQIQQERYRCLQVELEVDEGIIAQVLALRLLIQPLVENAFKHGYDKHRLPSEYIGIRGEVTEKGYAILIRDKGHGMEPDVYLQYNQAFESADASLMPDSITQMGLWNVHRRVRLAFGLPYGLRILHSGEDGTSMELLLPFAEK